MLGIGGVALDAENCTCKTGYTLDYARPYCVQNVVATVSAGSQTSIILDKTKAETAPPVKASPVVQKEAKKSLGSVSVSSKRTEPLNIRSTTSTTTSNPVPPKRTILQKVLGWFKWW